MVESMTEDSHVLETLNMNVLVTFIMNNKKKLQLTTGCITR